MKKNILTFLLLLLFGSLIAQEWQVPKNYVFNEEADYEKYEKDIVSCVNWMMKTPVNEQTDKRKEGGMFILQWLTGSPDVSVDINQNIVTFMEPNADLLMIFMGNWTKYAIESKDYQNKLQCNVKAIEGVITFYTKNKTKLKKDKNVEKYVKLKDKGELEKYIKGLL